MTALPATGPRLKAERERRGLSSQKAADELHLDGWVIDALEAENYERVGPSVYAKGHLKRYAALLGLPADEIMAGYDSRAQAPTPAAAQASNVRLLADAPRESTFPWPRVAGAAAVLLLALGVLWWKPWQRHGTVPAAGENVPAISNTVSTDASSPGAGGAPAMTPPRSASASVPASPSSSSAPVSPAASSLISAPAGAEGDAVAGMGRARLRLSFSADSWVDVHDAAGRRVFAGNGRANSMKTLAGIAPMRVYLGFASGVQVEINDRAVAIGPQFVAGDVARFEAGADGVLRRDSHSAAAPGVPLRTARPSG
jgi:cytoskeleton protein RodZ